MKNFAKLSEKAAKVFDSELTTKRTVPSVNDSLIDLMVEGGLKMTRTEMVRNVALHRLMTVHGDDTVMAWDDKKLKAELKAIKRTIQNGVDQAVSRAQNNAGFNYKYDGIYRLEQKQGVYSVIKLNQEG